MKNILVTGCAGFIGWKVSQILIGKNKKVIGIDNMNNYYDPALKRWRLNTLKKSRDFIFHKLDIANYEKLKNVFAHNKINAVINLAARAGVRASVENPWVYLDANTKGTLNLLECCRRFKVKKFVLASTSSIYGFEKMPFKEDKKTDTPLVPYSATKKGAEVLCYSYHYLYNLDISILRYFTVYGPAGRPDMSIFICIKNIESGKPVPVFGDGNQTRDFTYIDDIADGTVKALKPTGHEIINLGGDHPVKLKYVITLLEKNLGKKAKIKYLPRHPADVTATWAHIEKAQKLLGWRPKTSIEQGVEKTVKWFFDNKKFLKSLKW
ncbi:MAG: GDP-mannose 4,6-dehydratase [Thermodesulfovibrionia bacterium]|nr:GDP-mannose 4,6-dehydratase [Thermodesulfovibrionia bacterium]